MLFRFREVQAIEAGVSGGRNARRPRLASSCDSLKECERWRGEILREISRKVSKIQDGASGVSSFSLAGVIPEGGGRGGMGPWWCLELLYEDVELTRPTLLLPLPRSLPSLQSA